MTQDDWVKAILSNGAIGALVGAVSFWFFNGTLAKGARRGDYLKGQVQHLYGPVSFLLESAARIEAIRQLHSKAYEEHFAKHHHGERDSADMTNSIALTNRYAELMVKANREVAAILKDNWGWLDPEDSAPVSVFLTWVERQTTEEGWKLPLGFHHGIENKLPPIIVHDPRFTSYLQGKLKTKQLALASRSWWSRLLRKD